MEPPRICPAEILAAISKEPLLLKCGEKERQTFAELVRLLAEGQARLNLTAIKEPRAMVRYHLADSLALERAVGEYPAANGVDRAADIGTGGGFPLLPMAIVWPRTVWVGIESVGKKAKFVEETAAALALENVEVWAARAEDVGRSEERGEFDLVTSRAVGPVASLLEVSVPLLKVGGRVYMFKTETAMAEWQACADVLEMIGGAAVGEYRYSLEGDEQDRLIFVAEKVGETPEAYPRAAGVPFKKPLVKWDERGRKS